jgi:hypothetical protein
MTDLNLKAIAQQYAHGSGLLIHKPSKQVLKLAIDPIAMLKYTSNDNHNRTRVSTALALRQTIETETGDNPQVCLHSLVTKEFIEWASTPGKARVDVILYVAYRLFRVSSAAPRWRPAALCSWGTFRRSYLPAQKRYQNDEGPYDFAVSFIPANGRRTVKEKQLQQWADEGRIAEIDMLCSASAIGVRSTHAPAGRALLLTALGDIASRRAKGQSRYEAVLVSVSYNATAPYQSTQMKRLLESIGFDEVQLYNKDTNDFALDASNKVKKYMIIHNARERSDWRQRVASKIDIPSVCPRARGLGVAVCS